MLPKLDRNHSFGYGCPECKDRNHPFQPTLLGTANVQPHASCLFQLGYHFPLGAKSLMGSILKRRAIREYVMIFDKKGTEMDDYEIVSQKSIKETLANL
jgi:hypothetical protein